MGNRSLVEPGDVLVAALPEQVWADANPVTYPRLGVGAGGLTAKSTVLLGQVRSLDAQRVQEYLGTLSTGDLSRIRSGLRHILSL